MDDKQIEKRMVFAQLATLGLSLLGIYAFAPFILDEGALPGWEPVAKVGGHVINHIPWVKVATAVSLIPYIVVITRRIPRRAILETRQGFAEDTDRKDVPRQDRAAEVG